jgi:cob(I)alamin adenosyltransferase
MELEQGLVQVYTGDGKGKTTAALGQAVRSAGAGLKVLMMQFFKPASAPSAECSWDGLGQRLFFRRLEQRHPFFDKTADRNVLRTQILGALSGIQAEWSRGLWDVVVLDEVNVALRDHYVEWPEFDAFLASKPARVELICTGRGAPPPLIERADYVTEMRKVKHPMERKLAARKGIEF